MQATTAAEAQTEGKPIPSEWRRRAGAGMHSMMVVPERKRTSLNKLNFAFGATGTSLGWNYKPINDLANICAAEAAGEEQVWADCAVCSRQP